jgi:antitoxin HicB
MAVARRRQVVVTTDPEDGKWVAAVPSLPGCLTQGDTPEEAFANAEDAITTWIEGALRTGLVVPPEDLPPG